MLGIAPVSAPCDWFHETLSTKKQRAAMDSSHGIFGSPHATGCSAALKRWILRKFSGGRYHADKTKDYGMAGRHAYFQSKEEGGSKEVVAALDKDQFWVTKMMDSHLHGNNTKMSFYHTAACPPKQCKTEKKKKKKRGVSECQLREGTLPNNGWLS